jgi:hypothetical protein
MLTRSSIQDVVKFNRKRVSILRRQACVLGKVEMEIEANLLERKTNWMESHIDVLLQYGNEAAKKPKADILAFNMPRCP